MFNILNPLVLADENRPTIGVGRREICPVGMSIKAHLEAEQNAVPIFIKPHPVPYKMCRKLDAEYKCLKDTGIVEPVRYAQWASLAVPVLKRDRLVRVCGDYKVTLNKSLRKEVYPLPTPDDLFRKLEGGVWFA